MKMHRICGKGDAKTERHSLLASKPVLFIASSVSIQSMLESDCERLSLFDAREGSASSSLLGSL